MSKLYDLRQAMKTRLVAAGIGWTDKTILIKRQGSFWNDVATAIQAAKNGAVLHIGVAAGKNLDDEGLDFDLTIPVTIIAKPQVSKDARPEEDLWEDLVQTLAGMQLDAQAHGIYRLSVGEFTDIDIEMDGGTSYLGRQTIIHRRLSL